MLRRFLPPELLVDVVLLIEVADVPLELVEELKDSGLLPQIVVGACGLSFVLKLCD
jgi:hypothetical protein